MERLILTICLIALAFTAFAQCGDSDWWCTPYTAPAFPDDSLVLWFDMDSMAACSLYDYSGTGNLGKFNGDLPTDSTGYNPGCSDSVAQYFDGYNDYILIPNNASLQFGAGCDFTFYARFRTTGTGGRFIYSYTAPKGYNLGIDRSKILFYIYWSGAYTGFRHTGTTINDGSWHTAIAGRDGDSLWFDVDGIEQGRIGNANHDISCSRGQFIGVDWQLVHDFKGVISDIAVWRRTLTPTERTNLDTYNSISGACGAAPVTTGAKWRGVVIDGKLQTWRTQ